VLPASLAQPSLIPQILPNVQTPLSQLPPPPPPQPTVNRISTNIHLLSNHNDHGNNNGQVNSPLEAIDENKQGRNRRDEKRIADEARRKSNCVKEIEKIQKNREQRRAKQEEKRQKVHEADTSVPVWEFAQMINEYRSGLEFQRITTTEPVQDLRIYVCVRKRPINKKETSKKDIDVITVPNKDHCLVHLPKCKVDLTKYLDNQKFRFDFAFDENSTNDLVYRSVDDT
jgi:kinesin family protein 2/24